MLFLFAFAVIPRSAPSPKLWRVGDLLRGASFLKKWIFINCFVQEETMGKERDTKKDTKKKATKSIKEKRKAKQDKKKDKP